VALAVDLSVRHAINGKKRKTDKPKPKPPVQPAPKPIKQPQVIKQVVNTSATAEKETRHDRLWEVAKWNGPSEFMKQAAIRFGKQHQLAYAEVLAIWGYHPRTWRDL